MCSVLGRVLKPSQVVSQVVVFPAVCLTVFPGQREQASPSLKFPALQTETKFKIRSIRFFNYSKKICCLNSYEMTWGVKNMKLKLDLFKFYGVNNLKKTRAIYVFGYAIDMRTFLSGIVSVIFNRLQHIRHGYVNYNLSFSIKRIKQILRVDLPHAVWSELDTSLVSSHREQLVPLPAFGFIEFSGHLSQTPLFRRYPAPHSKIKIKIEWTV